ncbi:MULTISPECIES: DUF4381 family protein [unclassified Methylobacterium]|uniref:DUF4381 family protein n=1 Tax=unclassified Methylobacterium TaxID=2615210 RepID=UPI0006FE8497|nr:MULTISPECIES: DUF4381 family protein [unclassified Methylobacterium]KQO65550.1 hypothetical protein ASF20_06505 [Methylobacterium sp. Leaf88]KQU21118.1 hypothetical protein ASG63_05740 [Methylobacterium sp. Leaf94]
MTPDAPPGLDQLRGLHLPAETGGAQGAVMLAIALGFTAALVLGLLRLLRARRRGSVRRAALADLAAANALPPERRRVAQAQLLRRLARTLQGDAAADAQGDAWAAALDRLFATTFFSAGAGRIFAEGLYRRGASEPGPVDAELARLFARIGA